MNDKLSRAVRTLACALLLAACERERELATPAATQSPASALIERALPKFEAALHQSWPAPTALVRKARQAMLERNGREARRLARQELAQNPASDEARLLLSQIIYQNSAMGAARPGFEQILSSGPSFARAERVFYLYGNCLLRLGDADAAREAFQAHLKLNPEHGETHYSLGELALQEAAADRAIVHFERALELFQTSELKQGPFLFVDLARAHTSLGSAYFQKGALEQARESLQTSLMLNPNEPQPYYILSRLLARLGDREGARSATRTFQKLKQAAAPGKRRKLPKTPGGNR